MGKRIITLLMIVVAFTLTSCENATVRTMNEDEKLLYDTLCEKAQNFFNPASVKLLNASDVLSVNTEEELTSFRLQYFVGSDTGYYPEYKWGRQYRLIKVQLIADTKGGGSDNKVYCINIAKNDDAVPGSDTENQQFNYDELGTMWTFDDFMETTKEPYDDGTLETKYKIMEKQQYTLKFLKFAKDNNLIGIPKSGEYPISSGTKIDVAKINKALDEHWQEMGIK